tara:strand:- start:34 stop:2067 length:2034 start_codon:yes stop_codon:yes gene_type:complete
MPEQPGFWSAENFPYMPLLALGQAIPRGYQYQSQMTPYKRDAKGDWGRAINESIDQFFALYPQWQQQKRANALQREQLARQRIEDQHRAKLRPFELKQLETNQKLLEQKLQMQENYPQMVKNLKIPDQYKSFLLGLPPAEGLKMMQSYMTQMMKPRTQVLQANNPNNPFPGTPVNVDPSGKVTPINIPRKKISVPDGGILPGGSINQTGKTIQVDPLTETMTAPLGTTPRRNIVAATADHPQVKALEAEFGSDYVQRMLPYLREDRTFVREGQPGELIVSKGVETLNKDLQERLMQERRPSASQRFKTQFAGKENQISSYADLEPFAGARIESQKNFALTNLSPNHPLYKMAEDDYNRRFVQIGPNGVLVSEGYRGEYKVPGKKGFTSGKPESVRVNPGDTLGSIIKDFEARGIKVQPSQVIAANQHFFPDVNGRPSPDKMLTSAQLGGAEMIIPTGGPAMTDAQIGETHRTDFPVGGAKHRTVVLDGIGTIHSMKNATLKEEFELNSKLGKMREMESNVQEMLDLLYDPKARNWFKLGTEERGKVNGIRWRLVNNIQVLRDFGVLTPGEIEVIEESLPDMNSFLNLLASDFKHNSFGEVEHNGEVIFEGGSERFIKGALQVLMSEARTKQNSIRAIMNAYGIPEIGFEIDIYNPPGNNISPQQSGSSSQIDSFRSN